MRHFLAVLAALILPISASAAPDLTPHSAVYDMGYLKRATDSAFSQVDGRMVYRYDLTCDGATYNHRMVLDLVSKQGQTIRSETELSFYETRDGLQMRFHVKEKLNNRILSELEGTVSRESLDAPAVVSYSTREGAEGEPPASLPPRVMFPLQHTHDLIAAAMDGQVIHNAATFDGDEVSLADSFIQPARGVVREEAVVPKSMAGMKSWITRVGFYKPDSEEAVPYYETQMRFWENGLSGDFTMESDDLGVLAKLNQVELFDKPVCN